MEVKITSENFESYKNGELPLVVDLWATWCGPCKMLGPIISELANDYDGKIVVGKCDVEENNEVAAEFGVRSVPTILFFKGGELVDKFVGATNKEGRCSFPIPRKVRFLAMTMSEQARHCSFGLTKTFFNGGRQFVLLMWRVYVCSANLAH